MPRIHTFTRLVFLTTFALLVTHNSYAQESFDSPRLAALAKEIKAGNRAATDSFLEELKGKAPLVEAVKGDEQHLWVTFVFRTDAETKRAGMFGGLPTGDELSKPLTRLLDSDLWFRTEKLPKDSRFTYAFLVNYQKPAFDEKDWEEKLIKQMRRDVLNPRTFVFPPNSSVVELPAAPPQPWLQRLPDVPQGKFTRDKIKSEILSEERNVTIYTPPGYDPKGKPNGLLVLFDGEAFPMAVPLPAILDNLITKGKIPPMVAVTIDSQKTRNRDLPCSPNFADFLAKELVPWLRARYTISSDPKQTVITGFSFGGLAATYAGLRHSAVFGNVLSQSGSFWYFEKWSPKWDNAPFIESGWLTQQFISAPRLPLRFYLEVGQLEQGIPINMVVENRRMRDVLLAKGYDVTYAEYNGGHDILCWRGSLADGLIALVGKEPKK